MNKVQTKRRELALYALILPAASGACSPRYITPPSGSHSPRTPLAPFSSSAMMQPGPASGKEDATSGSQTPRASIFPDGPKSFIVRMPHGSVWSAALDVLLLNYNLTTVGREAGIITTEWDRFYLGQDVYRNKVSLRVVPGSFRTTRLTLVNNVEVLRKGESTGILNPVWMPAKDASGEAGRIIKAIAARLRLPPPVLPPGMSLSRSQNHSPILR